MEYLSMSHSSSAVLRTSDMRQPSSVPTLQIISFWDLRWNRMVLDPKGLSYWGHTL